MYISEELKLKHQLSDDEVKKASTDIDCLTFNRIRGKGFEQLTPFQKECITMALVDHAVFTKNNSDFLEKGIKSYSAGLTSVTFNEDTFLSVNGVTTTSSVIQLLEQTGLRFRGI